MPQCPMVLVTSHRLRLKGLSLCEAAKVELDTTVGLM